MSEFYRPVQEIPEDKEAFEKQIANAPDENTVDQLVEQKAHEILAEFNNELKPELEEKTFDEILDKYIPLDFRGDNLNPEYIPNISSTIYSEILSTENNDLVEFTLNRINTVLPEINKSLAILDNSDLNNNTTITEYKNRLLNYKREILLLKEQLEYRLHNEIFLTDINIEDALTKYRLYNEKLTSLQGTTDEPNDIENIMSLYADHIKEQFKQSSENYGSKTKSKALKLNITELVNQFMETELTKEESLHQIFVHDSKNTILQELIQVPGVVGIIPLVEGTVGSKNADIIAITLKNNNFTSEQVTNGLRYLYSKIQSFTSDNDSMKLDINNITIYSNAFVLDRDSLNSTANSTIDLVEMFQFHQIKIAKRSDTMKYDPDYQSYAQVMERPNEDWNNKHNVAGLTNSYYKTENGKQVPTEFNRALFQLSVQQILDLPLA